MCTTGRDIRAWSFASWVAGKVGTLACIMREVEQYQLHTVWLTSTQSAGSGTKILEKDLPLRGRYQVVLAVLPGYQEGHLYVTVSRCGEVTKQQFRVSGWHPRRDFRLAHLASGNVSGSPMRSWNALLRRGTSGTPPANPSATATRP